MARNLLKNIGNSERHTYTGTFIRWGRRPDYSGDGRTLLLINVKDVNGDVVTDHLWMNRTNGFERVEPKKGDVIQFDARVVKYIKGYFGIKKTPYLPPSIDWRLEYPSRIRNLTHPDHKPDGRET